MQSSNREKSTTGMEGEGPRKSAGGRLETAGSAKGPGGGVGLDASKMTLSMPALQAGDDDGSEEGGGGKRVPKAAPVLENPTLQHQLSNKERHRGAV